MTPILKTERGCVLPGKYELELFIAKHNLTLPAKISVKYKEGKRRKLKSLRLVSLDINKCEYCGSHTYLTYSRNGVVKTLEVF